MEIPVAGKEMWVSLYRYFRAGYTERVEVQRILSAQCNKRKNVKDIQYILFMENNATSVQFIILLLYRKQIIINMSI